MQEKPPTLGWAWVVVVLFGGSSLIHLARPSAFEAQVPDFLPLRTEIVVVSGVAELACAAGMAWPRTRRRASLAAAALLVAIFPGNLWQTFEAWQGWRDGSRSGGYLLGTLVRLPLQAPLIWWAWRAGKREVSATQVLRLSHDGDRGA